MSPIREVMETLRSLPGIVRVVELDERIRAKVLDLERGAEGNGAANGMMDFVNEGVRNALSREHCILLIIDSSEDFGEFSSQKLRMVDSDGNTVGEWLPRDRLEEMRSRDDVAFLSEDFVMYMDVDVMGDPYFEIMDMGFDAIESIDGVSRISSGSVSGPADDYLRNRFMGPDARCWTHIVGFDIG